MGIASSEFAVSVAVCIVALSGNYELVSVFTSDLASYRSTQNRVCVGLPWKSFVSPGSHVFGECGAINMSAHGECAGECADQLQMNSIANELNCK